MTPLPPLPADIAPMGRKGDDMTDTTHDIDALVKKANAITRHPSTGWVMAYAQDVLSDMSAALTALHAERDDAMALFHASDKQRQAIQAERDAWKARAEAAEAALTRAWERGRDDALDRIDRLPEYADAGVNIGVANAYEAIRALTPPADLAKGVADE